MARNFIWRLESDARTRRPGQTIRDGIFGQTYVIESIGPAEKRRFMRKKWCKIYVDHEGDTTDQE